MPYKKISELPKAVQGIPKHAKEIFMSAFNSAYSKYKNEVRVFKIAWSAVKKSYKKTADGKWVKK